MERVSLQAKLALLKVLLETIREASRPLEAIDSIKIVKVDGLTGGGGQATAGGHGPPAGGNLADSAVWAALRYRAQAPVLDGLMKDRGFDDATLDGLVRGAALPDSDARD